MIIFDKYILFYGNDWPSNFAESPITVDDDFWERGMWDGPEGNVPNITFKTAEAYYQSRKAVIAGDKYSYYKIAIAQTPAETKKIARKINLNSKVWDSVRLDYMRTTLMLKFSQNPEMKKKLLDPALDGKIFVEASPWDGFWGVKKTEDELVKEIKETGGVMLNESSANWLGTILNEIREKFI